MMITVGDGNGDGDESQAKSSHHRSYGTTATREKKENICNNKKTLETHTYRVCDWQTTAMKKKLYSDAYHVEVNQIDQI